MAQKRKAPAGISHIQVGLFNPARRSRAFFVICENLRNLWKIFVSKLFEKRETLRTTRPAILARLQLLERLRRFNELRNRYKPDFICFGEVIVELKALSRLGGTEEMQVLNYLRATGFKAGLLLNFGNPSLEFDRYVWSDRWNPSSQES
jgi:hypothetical protein